MIPWGRVGPHYGGGGLKFDIETKKKLNKECHEKSSQKLKKAFKWEYGEVIFLFFFLKQDLLYILV